MATTVWGAHTRLRVSVSAIAGRGVFAVDDLDADDPIETCPLLLLETSEVVGILHDMVVRTPSGPALPLGFGALYNHAHDPNAGWATGDDRMVVRARRPILEGEEITIFYGDSWFPSRGVEPR